MNKGNITKQKIAVVAWQLFHENGYENTTVDDIIQKSGTSKGSFYHYYSGKDELLSTLSDIFDAKYEELLKEMDPEMNSFDKLIHLTVKTHEMIGQEIPIDLLSYLYASQVTTKGDKHLLNQNRLYYRLINEIVDEGQRRGQIRSDMPYYEVAQLYIQCERAIVYDYCINEGRYNLGEYTKRVMPMIFGCVKA